MPHSISRRAAVKYALATLVSLTTSLFTWTWPQSRNRSLRQFLEPLTLDLTATASAKSSTLSAQITVHPINEDIRANGRFSPFLHNAYYLSHEGRFHQPILEATRSFRTDHAIQLTLQERLNSNHSLLS